MKHRFFSALNVGGLALGMAACLLIYQYVAFELSYDAFHANAEHFYRITRTPVIDSEARGTDAKTWHGMGPAFAADLPEIQNYTRYRWMRMSATVATLDGGERTRFMENRLAYADPAFLRMFSFPLLEGDPLSVLTEPGTLLLSASMAQKYFGAANPHLAFSALDLPIAGFYVHGEGRRLGRTTFVPRSHSPDEGLPIAGTKQTIQLHEAKMMSTAPGYQYFCHLACGISNELSVGNQSSSPEFILG